MSKKRVDIALVEISYSGGRKLLRSVMSITPNVEHPSTLVETMNADNRAVGRTYGVPKFGLEIEVKEERGTPEVDWDDLVLSKEEFQITWEEGIGGRRFTMVDVTADTISKSFDSGGEHTRSISCTALDQKIEN